MKRRFFAYCPQSGIEFFETEAEAEVFAIDAISDFRDSAWDGGWDEDVTGVRKGVVTHKAKPFNIETRPAAVSEDEDGYDDDGGAWPEGIGYKCDYELLPVEADLNSKLALLAKLLWRARSSVDYQMGSQNQNTDAGKAHIEGFKGLLVEIDSAISEYRTQGGDV